MPSRVPTNHALPHLTQCISSKALYCPADAQLHSGPTAATLSIWGFVGFGACFPAYAESLCASRQLGRDLTGTTFTHQPCTIPKDCHENFIKSRLLQDCLTAAFLRIGNLIVIGQLRGLDQALKFEELSSRRSLPTPGWRISCKASSRLRPSTHVSPQTAGNSGCFQHGMRDPCPSTVNLTVRVQDGCGTFS